MALALVGRIKGYLKNFIPSGDVAVSDTGVFTVAGMSLGAAVAKTIASGAFALTANKYHYKVAGEGGAADNLDSITGGAEGKMIVLRPSSDTVDITLRDTGGGTGNIRTPGAASIVLAEDNDYAVLVNDGTNWVVVAFRTQAGDIGTARLADALADKLWTVEVTAGAEAGNKRILSVQVKDVQGNNLAVATQLVFKPTTAVDASYTVSDEGEGTGLTISADKVSAILTSAAGLAEVGITDTAGETIAVAFETPLGPVVTSLVFAL